jgi:hypothetical protein
MSADFRTRLDHPRRECQYRARWHVSRHHHSGQSGGRRKMDSWGPSSYGAAENPVLARVGELIVGGEKWWSDKSDQELEAAVMRCPSAPALKEVRRLTGGVEYTVTALKTMGETGLLVAAQKIMGTRWEGIPAEARAWLVARLSGRKGILSESLLRACGCDFLEADAAARAEREERVKIAAEVDEEAAKIGKIYGQEIADVLLHFPETNLEEGEVRDLVGGDAGTQLRTAHGAAVRLGEKGVRSLKLLEALSGLNPAGVVRGPMVDVLGAAAAQTILDRAVLALKEAGIATPPIEAALLRAASARL